MYLFCLFALVDFMDSLDADLRWLPPLLIAGLPIVVGIAIVLGGLAEVALEERPDRESVRGAVPSSSEGRSGPPESDGAIGQVVMVWPAFLASARE